MGPLAIRALREKPESLDQRDDPTARLTQLYNETVVYKHKRHGQFKLDGRTFRFAMKPHFSSKPTRYFAAMTGEAMTETGVRYMWPGQVLCLLDGQNPMIVDRWPG